MGDPPPITKCRALIADLLPLRYPTLDRTARLLRLSTRTLQRRLRERENSYSHLVETIRLKRACRLLEEPGARVSDVAKALGYADPSSFSRAFRRWTGTSPRAYQRRIERNDLDDPLAEREPNSRVRDRETGQAKTRTR